MTLVSLLGTLFFALGYHFDNNWVLLLSGTFWFIAVIPLVMDNPIVALVMSALVVKARLYFFPPTPWYMHMLWAMLILILFIPMYRTVFIKR